MNNITSIDQLTETLDSIDPLLIASAMRRIKIPATELLQYATWSQECYTRNCLARTTRYELILLCWDKCAKTPIHDHGGEDCWVYQVQGTVRETRFEKIGGTLREQGKIELVPGRLTYMNDQMGFHSIQNISDSRAMTLHIYASPIDSCEVYNDKKACFETKEMSYHSYKGNELETTVL